MDALGQQHLETVLIGRRFELSALRALLDEARAGRGQVAIVEGEPGIGKSRLLSELVKVAAGDGFRVFSGQANELGPYQPFGLLTEALDLSLDSEDPERANLVRRIAGQNDSPPSVTLAAVPAAVHADLGFRIIESIVALVERTALEGPVLLALEDVHWSDGPSLRALVSLRRSSTHLPVALVVTLRSLPGGGLLDRGLDGLGRGSRHFVLEPLDDEDACLLAAAVAQLEPSEDLARRVAPARGNPLYVIELASSIADESCEPGPKPHSPSFDLTILRRLRALRDDTIGVLKLAAVLGRRFQLPELSALTGRTPVSLMPSLEACISANLLSEDDGGLAFRHELIRETVYRQIPAALRRGLHRQAAEALRTAGWPLERMVDHLLACAEPGDPEVVELLVGAALQCAASAPQQAVKLLLAARNVLAPDDPAAQTVAAALAPLLLQTGRLGEAEALSREFLGRCPPPALNAALWRTLGEVLWAQGLLEAAVVELDAAAAINEIPPTERVSAQALATYLRLFLGAAAEAEQRARQLRTQAARFDNDFAACLSCQTLAVAADATGYVHDGVELAREAVRIARISTDPRLGQLHPHLTLGFILLDADRFDEVERVLQQGRHGAEDRGAVAWLPLYHNTLAMHRVLSGAWDDAIAEIDAGLTLAGELGVRLYVPFLHGMAAWVALQRGQVSLAQERIDAATSEFLGRLSDGWHADVSQGFDAGVARWPLEWGMWIHALLLETRGETDEALSVLHDGWSVAAPLRYFLGYRVFGPDLVRLALLGDDRALADRVATEVEEGARRSSVAGAEGAALRCRGLVADEPDVLLQAVKTFRSSPRPIELAFTLEDAARCLAQHQREPEAVACLHEALARFEEAGAMLPAARTEAALRRLGVRRRRSAALQRPAKGWASLTPTERKVAELAGEGLTNRQIGERLFVSRRTVETHLAHAFRKLALTTRAQLAAEVARRSLS